MAVRHTKSLENRFNYGVKKGATEGIPNNKYHQVKVEYIKNPKSTAEKPLTGNWRFTVTADKEEMKAYDKANKYRAQNLDNSIPKPKTTLKQTQTGYMIDKNNLKQVNKIESEIKNAIGRKKGLQVHQFNIPATQKNGEIINSWANRTTSGYTQKELYQKQYQNRNAPKQEMVQAKQMEQKQTQPLPNPKTKGVGVEA